MIGIYKITNRINGKSYIGQSNNIDRRFREHTNKKSELNLSIKRAVKKYGKENFDLEILETIDIPNRDKLNELEMYYISLHKPEYNRTFGGSGQMGMFASDKTKELLRKSGKEQWNNKTDEEKNKILKNFKKTEIGHKVSIETREKLRLANIGKKATEETKNKMRQSMLNKKLNGYVRDNKKWYKRVVIIETNMEFESVKECAYYIGVIPASVSGVVTGRYKTCKGYHIKYVV